MILGQIRQEWFRGREVASSPVSGEVNGKPDPDIAFSKIPD